MFTIKSTRDISWPELALRKGDNVLTSRKVVPPALWPKLERFRTLKLLSFEGAANAEKSEDAKLEDLTEVQLFAMDKAALADLAKASGVSTVSLEPSKKELLMALVPKGKQLPKTEEPAPDVTVDPTGGGKAVVTNKPKPSPAGVSVSTSVKP